MSASAAPGRDPSTGRDPGLQAERTSLAWRRTVLSAIAGTSLVAFAADRSGNRPVLVLAAVLAAGIAGGVLRHARRPLPIRVAPWPVLVMAAGTVIALAALGLAGASTSILGRLP